eukprot:TRINITY_DN35225_c0_g1_i1.p1 TRINITY_DN35225_c0_g1~~TRINITY_DN35225_c0_g1_i1.p1  ORF type:complete len:255 (+),score=56.55 TRINITY_DN35225_c0_g1_i1:75-767(+)
MDDYRGPDFDAAWDAQREFYQAPQRHREVVWGLQLFAHLTDLRRDASARPLAPEMWREVKGWLWEGVGADPWSALWNVIDRSPYQSSAWDVSASTVSPYNPSRTWLDYYLSEEGRSVVRDLSWDEAHSILTHRDFALECAGLLPLLDTLVVQQQDLRDSVECIRLSHDHSMSLFSLDVVFRAGCSASVRSRLNFALIIHGHNKLKVQQDSNETRQFLQAQNEGQDHPSSI